MTKFRTFGLELECFHPTQDSGVSTTKIVNAIRAMGFKATDANYTGREYDKWQVKPDGSLTPYGKSLELVAPTLPGTEASFAQVKQVVEWMAAQGFDVNRSCGYHVHIGCADLTVAEQAAVAYRYHLRRSDINAVLPPSRHNGSYCAALDNIEVAKVTSAVRGRNEYWGHGERRVAVNLEHATKGTSGRRIEFRQHSGTLNWGKIFGWYRLLCDFIEATVALYRTGVVAAPAPAAAPITVPTAQRRVRRTVPTRTVSRVIGTHAPRVPCVEPGSDYDRFLRAIEANGVVTQQDGRMFGWPETRLRVTAHWLRRRGAALVTTERNGELAYVGRNGARTRNELFIHEGEVRIRTAANAATATMPVAPAPAQNAMQTTIDQIAVLDAPFEEGLSNDSLAWYRQRREDFGNT